MIIWFVQARQYQYLCEAKAARAETEAEVLSAEDYDADAKDVGGEGEHEEGEMSYLSSIGGQGWFRAEILFKWLSPWAASR